MHVLINYVFHRNQHDVMKNNSNIRFQNKVSTHILGELNKRNIIILENKYIDFIYKCAQFFLDVIYDTINILFEADNFVDLSTDKKFVDRYFIVIFS